MTEAELETKLMTLAKEERRITRETLSGPRFETLFDWLTRGVGYSESAARRRRLKPA